MVKKGKQANTKKSRGELKTEATRQALLDAAREMFAEKGLDLTTIDDITHRADVGKGTFYYHFKSKGRLIQELIRDMLTNLTAAIDEKCRGIDSLEDMLDSLIQAHLTFFGARWEDFVLHFQGRADLTLKEGYDGLDTPFNNYLEHIAELLDSVISYRLSRTVLSRISFAVAGFVSGYYSFAVVATEDKDLEDTLRPVRGALVAGLSRFIKEAIPDSAASVRGRSTA